MKKHNHLCLVCDKVIGHGDDYSCEVGTEDHDFALCDTCKQDPEIRKEYNVTD